MRVCIYGAGAIGGLLGAQLTLSGETVTLIARGAHLDAMRKNGVTLLIDGEERVAHPFCTDDPAEAGEQDCVIVTLKAHSAPAIVAPMQPLLAAHTSVVSAVNGVPWWYFYRLEGPWEDRRIKSVDPGGVQWDGIGPDRAIGCVVYPAAEVVEPGVVRHLAGNRFTLGEPSGEKTERVKAIAASLIAAGFRAPIRRLRDEIWVKLWGNLTFNPNKRAHARYPRHHRHRERHAGRLPRDDGRGAVDRREARRPLPGRRRAQDRRGGCGRCPPHVDAAGP